MNNGKRNGNGVLSICFTFKKTIFRRKKKNEKVDVPFFASK